MDKEWTSEGKFRQRLSRVLQLMNEYELTEFEIDDKDSDFSLTVSRSQEENFPPLLEGRSSSSPGQIRSPAVGVLSWSVSPEEQVSSGTELGSIEKGTEQVPIEAPRDGTVTERVDAGFVEFGQRLGYIGTESDLKEDDVKSESKQNTDQEDDESS